MSLLHSGVMLIQACGGGGEGGGDTTLVECLFSMNPLPDVEQAHRLVVVPELLPRDDLHPGAYTRPLFGSSGARFERYAGWRLHFSDKKWLRLS